MRRQPERLLESAPTSSTCLGRTRSVWPRTVGRPGCIFDPDAWEQLRVRLCLTQREREIVQLLLEGHREAQLGPLLRISPHTAHTHLGRIYRKLGVGGLPELFLCVFSVYLTLDSAPFSALQPQQTSLLKQKPNDRRRTVVT